MKKRKRAAAYALALLLLLAGCAGREGTLMPEPEPGHTEEPKPEPSVDPSPSVSVYAATGLDNPAVEKNGYLGEHFQTVDGFMTYTGPGGPGRVGIDVSAHQKEIDWTQVAESGVEFAIIRVGYRGYETGNLNLDAYFEANITGALENGLTVGIYFFSQATDVAEAEEEAAQVLEWIEPYPITYPVVFDWEPIWDAPARTDYVEDETVTECAKAFCEAVEAAGYIPAVYFNRNQGYGVMDLAKLSDYDFWLAEYEPVPSFRYHFEIWQYSCTGTVPGIALPVDLNLCLTEYPDGGGAP